MAAEIVITADDAGRISLRTNIQSAPLAIGLLEMAKASLLSPRQAEAKEAPPSIVLARAVPRL